MTQQTYIIGNMDCAHCAQEVETGVGKLDGVKQVSVNFSTTKMTLDGTVSFELLQKRVESLGKTICTIDAAKNEMPTDSRGGILGFWNYLQQHRETRLALIGTLFVIIPFILGFLMNGNGNVTEWLITIGLVIIVLPIAKNGFNTLRINHQFNINLLMTIAAVGAVLIGEYLEAFTVIFLFIIGEALEGYTADRARNSLRSLLSLKPKQAIRITNTHIEELIPVEQLQIGDQILVMSGERIPMDGIIIKGTSSVNQAPITGESIPVHKALEDEVFAGTINGDGVLHIRVTHLAEDNTLTRIIRMVEEAQTVRAPSQRFIDQFANIYTPAVFVMAILVATIPSLVFNAPFFDTAEGRGWLYRALTMLVIACPCALVISTPVTVISAITNAARNGVLVKGGLHLEALGKIKAFAFDKTGTLTKGQPMIQQIRAIDCETGEPCEKCDDILALTASIEQHSTHPLAQTIVHSAKALNGNQQYATAEDVQVLAGQGIRGMVDNQLITVGSHRFFDEQYPHSQEFCNLVTQAEQQGETTILVNDGDGVRGFISVADEPRDNSRAIIQQLNQFGLTTVMLTGDHQTVAHAIAEKIGIQDVHAELMPEDKVHAVESLLQQYGTVAMVGDGINDTPALATATVGIAMGGAGSSQALETADVVLMADDLAKLPFIWKLSRFARSIIRQNIVLSLVMKAGFLLLALGGMTTLWMAIFADVGMSLIVTLNGMRPLRQKPES